MDRATIGDLYLELSSDEMFRNFIWNDCKDIEVVPRKMVEMIIEKCEETIKKQERAIACSDAGSYISSNAHAVRISALQFKEYTETLLKQLEENKDECIL